MITIKNEKDIGNLKIGGKRIAEVLNNLEKMVAPGITGADLNNRAEEMIKDFGDECAFLGYSPHGAKRPYPSALCVSINDEIVHGISNENPKTIKEGDIVSIDLGLTHNGMILDSARTVIAGEGDKIAKNLVKSTREALTAGISAIKTGGHVGDIGFAVQMIAKEYGFSVAEGLAGHGVGYEVHEDPYVPNKGKKGTGEKLISGMVIAIEPMFCEGKGKITLAKDGFTYKTADGMRSAHFEHTVLITKDGPEILTI